MFILLWWCLQLLQTLLAYNPYNGTLDLSVNEMRSKQAEAELQAMIPVRPDGESSEPAREEDEGGENHDQTAGE